MSIATSEQSVTLTRLLISQMAERMAYTELLEAQAIANMKSIRKQAELLTKLRGWPGRDTDSIRCQKWHQKRLEEFKANAIEFNQQLQRHEIESSEIMRHLKETDMAIAQLKNWTQAF